MFSCSRSRLFSFLAFPVIFVIALAVAGCGSGGAKFASTPPTATTSAGSASTTPPSSSSSSTPSSNPPASSPSSPPSSPPPSPSPSPSPAPQPSPAPGPSPAPAVTQYLYTADAGTNTISAFKINSDGTLTAATGGGTSSPLIVRGAATDTLLVGNTELQAFTVDASTGAIHNSDTLTPGPADLAVDRTGAFAYQININPCQAGSCRDVSAYRVLNGTLQFIGGDAIKEGGTGPYTGAPVNPLFEAVDPAGRYLFIAGSPGPGPTPGVEFRAISRNPDGTLGSASPRQRDLCSNVAQMAAASSGKLSFVYNSCGKDHMIQWTVFDAGTNSVVSSGQALTSGTPQPLAVDPAGKFLLAGDSTGNMVEVYSIDQATGTISQTQQIAAGNHPSGITFDSTGQFVYVTNFGSDNLSAYRFSNGTLQPIATYATGQGPESVTVVKP
jgi:DNA-binding beta-propeller fold protein YncE